MSKHVESFVIAESKGIATGLTNIGSVVGFTITISKKKLTGSNPINCVSALVSLGHTSVIGKVGKPLWEAILSIPKVHFQILRDDSRKDNAGFHKLCAEYRTQLDREKSKRKSKKVSKKIAKTVPDKETIAKTES